MDAGYFRDEGIDLQLTPNNGSSTAFLPMLARGDFDLGTANPSPAFFNQFSAGFNVVLLAGQTGSHAGWHDTTWLMVRQDLWDSKTIRVPADLKGKIADGANVGSPIDFLLKQTIRNGGVDGERRARRRTLQVAGRCARRLEESCRRRRRHQRTGGGSNRGARVRAPLAFVQHRRAVVSARVSRRIGEVRGGASRRSSAASSGPTCAATTTSSRAAGSGRR